MEDNSAQEDKEKMNAIIANTEKPAIWVFTGNSITQGAKHTHGLRSYPEIFSERIRWEKQRSRDFIINTAISGNTTKDILAGFDQRIAQFHPQVVSLMIGTNDAGARSNISTVQFKDNLLEIITKIRNIGAIPILLTPSMVIETNAPATYPLSEYVAVIREVAYDQKVILVDNWLIWENDMQVKYDNNVNKKLLNDRLHPNGLGHKEIAIAMFKELSIFNPKEPTCGGPYYEGEH